MAMAKPIVATHAGGVSEIITDNSTGLLVPPRNVQALAEAIKKLTKDPELCAFLSKKAHAEALTKFDVTRCVNQLVLSLDAL